MKNWVLSVVIIAVSSVVLCCCSPLPIKTPDMRSAMPQQDRDTQLHKIFFPTVQDNTDASGVLLLRDGKRALVERLYLIDMAEHTIEVQYYIWNSDKSGRLLMQRLLLAAERGVSVRLLLDDFSIGDRNDQLLALNSYPNIEIRVNNPFIMRSGVGKWLNFASDFDRLNRRMHNKTFTVDGTVAITGGRNIGDEYFHQDEHLNFNDADLLSTGPVVKEVSESFFKYWNGPLAVPIDQLLENDKNKTLDSHINDLLHSDLAASLQFALPEEQKVLENHFHHLVKQLIWAKASFIADDPWKNEDAPTKEPKRVARHLLQLAEQSRKEILIESAYFVLNKESLEMVDRWRGKGVKIRALTNSMASNDVLPNHASYAMVRKDMLKHGIELYELRPDAKSCLEIIGRKEYCDEDSHLGLHAKTAVFDRNTVYVGSMNLNLRSAFLNTEAAMIIESPVLAEQLTGQIELNMSLENSWQAIIKDDQVQWITDLDGQVEKSSHEPRTSWMERVEKNLLMILPGSQYY